MKKKILQIIHRDKQGFGSVALGRLVFSDESYQVFPFDITLDKIEKMLILDDDRERLKKYYRLRTIEIKYLD